MKTIDSDTMKKNAAIAALDFVEQNSIIGVGSGSTVAHFIDALAQSTQVEVAGAVASSERTAELLAAAGIEVHDLNSSGPLATYIDGADESDEHLRLIKGGGGALTREKIIAAASEKFVCIADGSKMVDVLGTFPLPVEVIPMARSYVARELVKLNGDPELRDQYRTDNGNVILDVHNLKITDPVALEAQINQITGVVTCGLFAKRPADILLLAKADGEIEKITR